MKRLFWLYTLLSLVGCTEVTIEDKVPTNSGEYYATIEEGNSRTYVDEQIRMRWTAEDRITLFEKNTYNRTFMFTGKTGANAGGFRRVSTDDDYWFGYDVDANYAVYPHSDDNTLDETKLFLTVNMPAEQTYAENSFGLGANTMVAVSETGQLIFKNVCSYLRIRLYGNNTSVSSITFTNKGNEAIAGEAKVTPVINGEPTCVMTGSSKSIRLTCPTPVSISSDANSPTDFWIVIPPVTLSCGFTVTVENSDGNKQTYDVDKSFTFERNKYYDMVRELEIENTLTIHVTKGKLSSLISDEDKYAITSLKVSGELNGDDILFIREMAGSNINGELVKTNTSNTEIITKGKLSYLDLTDAIISEGGGAYCYTSKTTSNTIGNYMFFNCHSLVILKLPQGVTSIGNDAFNYCRQLERIDIPSSVEEIKGFAFSNCYNLTNITLPSQLTQLSESLFANCTSLSKIKIPSKITDIGNLSFTGCTGLQEVYSYATTPPQLSNWGGNNSCILYVPQGYVNLYKNSIWSNFFLEIKEM